MGFVRANLNEGLHTKAKLQFVGMGVDTLDPTQERASPTTIVEGLIR